MTIAVLSPIWGSSEQAFTNQGVVLAGGKLYVYTAGTTTPETTWTTSALSTANANPLIFVSSGRLATQIWLSAAVLYKFVLKDSNDNTLGTWDNIYGIGSPLSSNSYFIQSGTGAVATDLQTDSRTSKKLTHWMSAAQIADAEAGTHSIDCSAATQAAITWCVANNFDLEVPYLVLLSSAVNINRQVDGAAYDNYFNIWTGSGGGFYVTSAIKMFTSSISFSTAPVSQLVKFSGIHFGSDDATRAAYILDDGRFLRSAFDGCSFSKIKCVNSTIYLQSLFFNNCNIRRGNGLFLTATAQAYDVRFTGANLVEAWTGSFMSLANPVGCVVEGVYEGISGTAIVYNGAQGLDICAYFEGNGLDIDGTGSNVAYGVNLHGSYFSHANSAQYSVIWGAGGQLGCRSHGNYHNGSFHQILGGAGTNDLQIDDVAQTSLSNRNHQGNTIRGVGALTNNNTGTRNTAFGKRALATNANANNNTAVGDDALLSLSGASAQGNVAVGYDSLSLGTTSVENTAVGRSALKTGGGTGHVAVGAYALGVTTTSNYSVAIGYQALDSVTTGDVNIGIGLLAGETITTGANNICLGHDAQASAASVSNEVTIGSTAMRVMRTAAATYPAKDGHSYQSACGIYAGSGAPNNANGADGDIYFRSDGGAMTTMYQRRAGAWVGIV